MFSVPLLVAVVMVREWSHSFLHVLGSLTCSFVRGDLMKGKRTFCQVLLCCLFFIDKFCLWPSQLLVQVGWLVAAGKHGGAAAR